jgi:hypothetical protein
MRHTLSFIFVFFTFYNLNAQETIEIKGTIFDTAQNIVPYAAIQIRGKAVGTAADHKGDFHLSFSREYVGDTLEISALGYLKGLHLIKGHSSSLNVKLEPKSIGLQEVEITATKAKTTRIGVPRNRKGIGIISSRKFYRQHALMIKYDQLYEGAPLESVELNFSGEGYKSPFRLRIYSINESGQPDQDILEHQIIQTPDRKRFRIDLKSYNITLPKGGIVVAYEIVETATRIRNKVSTSGESYYSQTLAPYIKSHRIKEKKEEYQKMDWWMFDPDKQEWSLSPYTYTEDNKKIVPAIAIKVIE